MGWPVIVEDETEATKAFFESIKGWVETEIAAIEGGAVASVFGRTGSVVAKSGDYTAAQVGADATGAAAALNIKSENSLGITGTPTAGEVLTATNGTKANWAPASGSTIRTVAPPSTASTEAEKATANTTAIQNAINEGPGTVRLREGTYIANLIELKTKVMIEGAGINATIVKLRSGANTDLLHSENWETLKGSQKDEGIISGGFRNITWDGNKASNTSPALVEHSGTEGESKNASKIFKSKVKTFKSTDQGGLIFGEKIPQGVFVAKYISETEIELSLEAEGTATGLHFTVVPPSSGLISLYGKGFLCEDFTVQDPAGHGFYSEWGNEGGSEMEAYVQKFKIIRSGKSGLVWHGPHDSMISEGTVQNAEQYGVWAAGNAGSDQFNNVHCWGEEQTLAWRLDREALLIGCQGEGAKEANLFIGHNHTSVLGGQWFLSPIGIKVGWQGKEIAGAYINTQVQECSNTTLEIVGNDWEGFYALNVSPHEEKQAAVFKGSFAENSYVFLRVLGASMGSYMQYPNNTVLGGLSGPGLTIGSVGAGLGFFGAAPVGRPAKPAETTKSIIEALEKLGLVA